MFDYSEKRDHLRMIMGCPARYRPDGSDDVENAVVKNLSADGMLLQTDKPVPADIQMSLEVMPGKTITPPLSAYVKVLRCDAQNEGGFSVACTIERILQDNEVGPDFP